jgi:DNA repair exonuclease SbcCD nuclease subunit
MYSIFISSPASRRFVVAVKILHTADWQLGKAFAKFPDEAAVPLREQRVTTIKKIAALAVQEQVDAVLVAGDVFEFENIADKLLHQTLHAMSAYRGPWLMLPGNHDPATAESVWWQLRRLEPPDNVVIIDKPLAYEIPGKNAVVLAAPLQRKHEAVDITQWFDGHATTPDGIRIGLAHGSLDNRLPERGEAANTISDKRTEKADLDYLAMGDWHGTLQIDRRIWYAGTHETDRFKDNDSGNVLLVTIEKHGAQPQVSAVPVGHFTWTQLTASIDSSDGIADVERALQALGDKPEQLVVQVSINGTIDLETRARLEKLSTRWSALLRHLEIKEEGLVTQASPADLDELGRSGFIAETVRRLRTISAETSDPLNAEIATLALQMLYAEHKQVSK